MAQVFKLVFVALLIAQSQASILRSIFADDSCQGRCNVTGTVPGAPCQCNTACVRYDDCCPDYYSLCLGQTGSCVGRCDQSGTVPGTCQCNKPCVDFGDCCPDYSDVCQPTDGVSDRELEDLGEELLGLDTESNAASYIQLDLQGKTSSGSSQDVAPLPLMTVASAAYTRPTIQKLLALHDIYDANVNIGEAYSAAEEAKINDFLDAIFATPIMQRAQDFLASKNLPNGRSNFYELWFGLFSRGNGALGSCGLEHVLMAELRGTDNVLGFHNWVFYALEEAASRVNYRGWMETVDLGSKGSIIEHNFVWQNTNKPVSSMFVGTSPELELALYTVCFYARSGAKCGVKLNGQVVKIQTYTSGSRGQFVGTAYPDLSG
ncbi:unnamed protein product [Orchesella dallaii]|uniref:Uncharacterized protein n=1 Tax=Orchesella dallaii TaxID=48710 RepID=A0ABP1RDT4_9HEXA